MPEAWDGLDSIHKAILDAHADCCDTLARCLAAVPVLPPSAIQALDGYAVLVGRENVPPDVWAAMSREPAPSPRKEPMNSSSEGERVEFAYEDVDGESSVVEVVQEGWGRPIPGEPGPFMVKFADASPMDRETALRFATWLEDRAYAKPAPPPNPAQEEQ